MVAKGCLKCRFLLFLLLISFSTCTGVWYKQTTQRLLHAHGITADKETVREMLKILDPEGVQLRSRHRLQRRKYKTAGQTIYGTSMVMTN